MTKAEVVLYAIQGLGPVYELANQNSRRYVHCIDAWTRLMNEGVDEALEGITASDATYSFLDWMYGVPNKNPPPEPQWLAEWRWNKKIREAKDRAYREAVPPEPLKPDDPGPEGGPVN